jgi:hypothetical protein
MKDAGAKSQQAGVGASQQVVTAELKVLPEGRVYVRGAGMLS